MPKRDPRKTDDQIDLQHDGRQYRWTERTGFVDEHWQHPPQVIQRVLMKKLEAILADSDLLISNAPLAVRRAVKAKSQAHYTRAERLARHALSLDPQSETAAAVLSSALRAQNRAKEALVVTGRFLPSDNTALLTTRAAAFLDVGDVGAADRLARRAWAVAKERRNNTEELSMVFRRLEQVRQNPRA